MTHRQGQAGPGRSIRQQINRLLGTVTVSSAVILLILILMLVSINRRYEKALLCVNTAADFNKEFKTNIDLAMYHHVIQPRGGRAAEDLPTGELDQAEDVFRQLENATTLPDNREFLAFVDTQGLGRTDYLVPQIVMKVYKVSKVRRLPLL